MPVVASRRVSNSRKRLLLAILIAFLALSTLTTHAVAFASSASQQSSCSGYSKPPSASNYAALANYLVSTYNSTVGLVYESNEAGTSPVSHHLYNQTYWINNDNVLASWALWKNCALNSSVQAYSALINNTIQQYDKEYNLPLGNFYQVLSGIPLASSEIQNDNNYNITVTPSYAVDDEIHNSSSSDLAYQNYTNTLIVHSLNNYLKGNISGAFDDFNGALKAWNGEGFNDSANNGNATQGYADYKIAIVLFAAQVLGVSIASNAALSEMQKVLWSNFIPGGGIKVNYGCCDNSTNAETDSFALLAYNPVLIHLMQSRQITPKLNPTSGSLSKGEHLKTTLTLSGEPQKVALSYRPISGISVKFAKSSVQNSYTGVSDAITITDSSANQINDNITIIATGANGERSSINFILT